jgi:hypothetical protein
MNAILDFPVIAPESQPMPAAVAPLSIKETVLQQFRATEPGLIALADKYRRVAFDCSTTKGLDQAKTARLELREQGRYAVQRAEKRIKTEVNDLKATMAEEAARLIAIIEPVEAHVDGQIKAREEQLAAEKAERERIAAEAAAAAAKAEAERKARHEAGIAKIRSYVAQAAGRTASQIEAGIRYVQSVQIGPEWEEYSAQAQAELDATLGALRTLHADTLAREEREAEAARVAAENARVAAENARIAAELAEQRRAIEAQAAALKAQQEAAEREARAKREAEELAAQRAESERLEALATMRRQTLQTAQEIAQKMPECVESGGIEPDAANRIMGVVAALAADTAIEQASAPLVAFDAAVTAAVEAHRAAAPAPEPATLTLGAIGELLGFDLRYAFVAEVLKVPGTKAPKGPGYLFTATDKETLLYALADHLDGLIAKHCGAVD